MSASQLSVFLPIQMNYAQLLHGVSKNLLLAVDVLPPDFPFAFSAQKSGEEYLLIEYDANAGDIIDEITQWEKPSQEYKLHLGGCSPCINIHYRDIKVAKDCVVIIGNFLGQSSTRCIVENGYGCLLRLSDLIAHCNRNSTWSWEKDSFPDIPGVADSEWSE